MISEVSTLIDCAESIRAAYEKEGIPDEFWDYNLHAMILDLIESLNELDEIKKDEWYTGY